MVKIFFLIFFIAITTLAQNSTSIKGPSLYESYTKRSVVNGTVQLGCNDNTYQYINVTGPSSVIVKLPDATQCSLGRRFIISSEAGSVGLIIHNFANTPLDVLIPKPASDTTGAVNIGSYILTDKATSGGVWAKNQAGSMSFNYLGAYEDFFNDKRSIGYGDIIYGLSTGLKGGGICTQNTATTINVSSVEGQVIDKALGYPVKLPVSGNITNYSINNISTHDATYIYVSAPNIFGQQITEPTPQERRNKVYLCRVGHPNRTIIQSIVPVPDLLEWPANLTNDLAISLGTFNIIGNAVTAGGLLELDKSEGKIFGTNYNYYGDSKNPSILDVSQVSSFNFIYGLRSGGSTSGIVNDVDPTRYDLNGVLTTIPGPAASASIQRIFLTVNNLYVIQYGQEVYDNLSEARAGLSTEIFETNNNLVGRSIILAYLIVEKGCSDLTTSCAQIIQAGKFGGPTGGGGGSDGGGGVEFIGEDLSLTANDTLSIPTESNRQVWTIQASSSPITMNVLPFSNVIPLNGTEIRLIGISDSATVTFPKNDASKGIIPYGFTLAKGKSVTVKFNTALDRYVVIGSSN